MVVFFFSSVSLYAELWLHNVLSIYVHEGVNEVTWRNAAHISVVMNVFNPVPVQCHSMNLCCLSVPHRPCKNGRQ